MKIKEIMTPEPVTCSPATDLAVAAELMLKADSGFLPVVDQGKLIGVVTDRDMFIALATRNKLPSQLTVGEVGRKDVFACAPDDDVRAALATMKQRRVRRLPVQGPGQTLVGVVSMNDVLLTACQAGAVRHDEVVDTFQAICTHAKAAPATLVAA